MKIAIASDHAGYELKEKLKSYLKSALSCEVVDLGTGSPDSVDYPDFAHSLSAKVSNQEFEKGVLVCGSGIGMCMTANRYPGVRAVVLRVPDDATMSRLHNDANVACLGERFTPYEEAKDLLDSWLNTPFEGGRHFRRVTKIEKQ